MINAITISSTFCRIKVSVLTFGFLFLVVSAVHGQDVIKASGGTNISIDSVATGGYVELSGPTIRETATSQLEENGTVVLTLPNGYEWNTDLTVMPQATQGDVGTEDITFTVEAVGAQNTDLELEFTELTASEFTFTITSSSQSAGAGKGPGRITISGLQIHPTNTNVPDENTISNTGTTAPTDANYGNLSKEPGNIDEIRVETESDGSGILVAEQDILAGNSITVYSIARDFGGNFISNISLENESDWSLIDIDGSLTQSTLSPSSSLRNATFSSQNTGSAKIQASHSDGTSVPSETITVLPRSADEMQISIQPSETATSGEPFGTQPVIELLDQFGNLVTTDSTTEITAAIESGEGTLLGTTTQTADSGVVEFTGLYSETADNVTLRFTSTDLDDIISSEIVIEPNDAADLVFLQQPTNTAQNATIDPPVEVQLLDDFGNEVQADGIDITISDETFFKGNSTRTVATNNGIAVFDNLQIQQSASEGEVDFTAEFTGINSPVTSESFEIINSGDLAKFVITNTSDADIGQQEAGAAFGIRIKAIDGNGDTFTNFEDAVEVTADADLQMGGSAVTSFTTGNFTQGVLDTSITLVSSGETRVYAENTDVNRDGQSNKFSVEATDVDFDSTIISSDPDQITANGSETSEITVHLRDEFGNNLTSGGETITILTDAGTLSTDSESGQASVTADDQGDGTYTATLTSSTNIETANVQTENDLGETIAAIQVDFTSGDLQEFLITIPQNNGEPAVQTAGTPFNISVEAVDQNGNRVSSYSGTLEFSTNSEISAGGTASISDGLLQDHSVTLTKSDSSTTISVEDPDIFDVDGTSEAFIVEATGPDASSSQVTANPVVIQNDGSSESIITLTLKDAFDNKIFSDFSSNLTLTAVQIQVDGSPSSGSPDATVSSLSFNTSNSTYTATLTSSTTIEDVEISVEINGNLIQQQPVVQIVVPNTWEPSGSPNQRTDWERGANWSLGTIPDESDFVVIPGGLDDYPDLDLNVSLGSLEIEQNGELVLFGGNAIEVAGTVRLDGTLDIEDNTSLLIGGSLVGSGTFASDQSAEIEIGGDLSLANFLARTNGTIIRFNGSDQQTITSPNILAQKLEILNDIVAPSGDLIDTSEMLITEGNTFELLQDAGITLDNLKNISGDGQFILNNNTLVVRGDLNLLNIDTSEGTVIFGIRLNEDFADYPDLERQQIANLSEMKNAVINNTEDVLTFEDITVNGDLTLENGELIISSGKSLIAPNQIYNNGSISIRRTINDQGWLMVSAPINSDFADLFDGLTVQGMASSTYPDRQPNVLYYNETIEGTDNQRWRTPADINDPIQDPDSTGRGFFFYVFGDVEEDEDYNDVLPVTLTVTGEEYQHQSNTFNFSSVTHTAQADTGFNLIGNPWAATVDWDEGNWTKTNIDNVIYIWDSETNDYLTWNGIDGSLGDGRIKPFQAFWIKANDADPVLSVEKSAKTTGGTFRGKSKKEPASIEFLLEAGEQRKTTHITLSTDGKTGKDQWDAYRLLPFDTDTYLELYTALENGTELSINNLPRSFGKEISIPLYAGGYQNGDAIDEEYILSWPQFSDIPDSWTIILEDRENNEEIDLINNKNDFYAFNHSTDIKKGAVVNSPSNFRLTSGSGSKKKKSDESPRFYIRIDPGADAGGLPNEYKLGINYPNPFRDQTTIKFETPLEGRVQLLIYDILGRKVKTLINEDFQAGFHEYDWTPNRLASGVYICIMRAGGKQFSKKMTYIK